MLHVGTGRRNPQNSRPQGAGFNPQSLGSLAAWYKFNTGITIEGIGVSIWADQSGNGRNLVQATDANRPAFSAGELTFDGTNSFLGATTGSAIGQPATIYVLGKWITWTNETWFDGTTGRNAMFGITAEATFAIFAGSTAANNSGMVTGVYAAVACLFNGASSAAQVNLGTPTTGNANTAGLNGTFFVGQNNGGASRSNIAVKEIIIYAAAHNQATRNIVNSYLLTI